MTDEVTASDAYSDAQVTDLATREQVEAEAAELYPAPADPYTPHEAFQERAAHVRAKTVSAEHVEAAAHGVTARLVEAILAGEVEIKAHGPGISFERDLARAAFRAAGLLIEGDDQ